MVSVSDCLIDTNILLRFSRKSDPQHRAVQAALETLNRQGAELFYSLQNIAEFWNVCTRPQNRNGYGLSTDATKQQVVWIESTMTLLPDDEQVYSFWRRLVWENDVRGVQVHDARLAALMEVYAVSHILTLNRPDFTRYSKLQVLHPDQMQPSAST